MDIGPNFDFIFDLEYVLFYARTVPNDVLCISNHYVYA